MSYKASLQGWLETFIIAKNLCPFAKRPFVQKLIKIRIVESDQETDLTQALLEELALLAEKNRQEVETTLLGHPHLLDGFLDFLDYLNWANSLVEEAGLTGVIQLVGFHPDYQFAGESSKDLAHYTNRSPFPLIHLLREESVSEAVDQYPDVDQIPQQNIQLLRSMNREDLEDLVLRKK